MEPPLILIYQNINSDKVEIITITISSALVRDFKGAPLFISKPIPWSASEPIVHDWRLSMFAEQPSHKEVLRSSLKGEHVLVFKYMPMKSRAFKTERKTLHLHREVLTIPLHLGALTLGSPRAPPWSILTFLIQR